MSDSNKSKVFVILGGGGWRAQTDRLINHLEKDSDLYYAVIEDGVISAETKAKEKVRILPRTVFPSKIKMCMQILIGIFCWIKIMLKDKPDCVVAVATPDAIPMFIVAKMFGVKRVFIESLTRVSDLSQTGLTIYKYKLASRLYVQWPNYLNKYNGLIYKGCI